MRALLLTLLLLLAGAARAAEPDIHPACQAAARPERYDGLEPSFVAAFKAPIAAYRGRWAALCQAPTAGRSLGALYAEMTGLATRMARAVDQESFVRGSRIGSVTPAPAPSAFPALHETLFSQLDFIPLIQCFTYDGAPTCEPHMEQFLALAASGDPDDQRFAAAYATVRGTRTMPPYINQTWDYGGCTEYGEFDWVGALRSVDVATSSMHTAAYIDALGRERQGMLEWIAGDVLRGRTCSCAVKDGPLTDLPAMLAYLGARPTDAAVHTELQALLVGLQSGKIQRGLETAEICSVP